jgi:D-sedoheptulose 7-phosphate isomerase
MKTAPRSTRPGGYHDTGPGGLDAEKFARWYRDEMTRLWRELDLEALSRAAALVLDARAKGRHVFIMGNGGSAAAASHMAVDFSKTAEAKGKPRVKSLSLTDNVPFLSAVANDHSFDAAFEHQLDPLLKPKDVVILITGSGNSPNLIRAARLSRRRGAATVGLLGFDGGALRRLVDVPLLIPSVQYGAIEDMHMSIGHIIAFYLKQAR